MFNARAIAAQFPLLLSGLLQRRQEAFVAPAASGIRLQAGYL
jgi:hypothetical protein